MRTETIKGSTTSALLILEPGDSLRCDDGTICCVIEMGTKYTVTSSISVGDET